MKSMTRAAVALDDEQLCMFIRRIGEDSLVSGLCCGKHLLRLSQWGWHSSSF